MIYLQIYLSLSKYNKEHISLFAKLITIFGINTEDMQMRIYIFSRTAEFCWDKDLTWRLLSTLLFSCYNVKL